MTDCAVCAHAELHGWWGSDHHGTHCRRCHRSWIGRAEAHCPMCCRHFGSDRAAQVHKRSSRDGERVWCVDPATIFDRHGQPRLKLTVRASGKVWVQTRPEPFPALSRRPQPRSAPPVGVA
jgi:hypothetical protein